MTLEPRQSESGVVAPRTYEYGHRESPFDSAHQALEAASNDALAAASLGLRVLIEPIAWQQFRGGGNVNKADLKGYRLTFPDKARDA